MCRSWRGDITKRLERHAPFIGHVQLASVPDRVEPDEGELKLGHILGALDRVGYDRLIGLEYKPRGDTRAGLSWIDRVSAGAIGASPTVLSSGPGVPAISDTSL